MLKRGRPGTSRNRWIKNHWDKALNTFEILLNSSASYHLIRTFCASIANALHQRTEAPFAISIKLDKELDLGLSNTARSSAPAVSRVGNGLANIFFRADEIGAKVDWRTEEGTLI